MWDKVVKGCVFLLAFLCIFNIGLYYYFNFIITKDPHITGAFIGNQVDPQTGVEKSLLEVNVYSNGNNRGKKVVEFVINCFSESTHQKLAPIGVQYVDGQIYYYSMSNDIKWVSAEPIKFAELIEVDVYKGKYQTDLSQATMFPIDIAGDDGNFALAFSGQYETTRWIKNTWKVIANCFSFGLPSIIAGKEGHSDLVNVKQAYTLTDFINYCETLATSLSSGYGDTYIDAIDLSAYFGLYKLDSLGKYCDVEMHSASGDSKYYFSANVHYDNRGMQLAKQSLFGAVAGNSQYNSTGIDSLEYWRSDVNYMLTNDDFVLNYDVEDEGYYLSIKDSTLRKLNNYTANVVCDYTIDLDSFTEKVIGIDYYGLNGVKLKNLSIHSLIPRNFKFRDYALLDCEIANFTTTGNINLTFAQNAYNGGNL